jgi:hypothetical protein
VLSQKRPLDLAAAGVQNVDEALFELIAKSKL